MSRAGTPAAEDSPANRPPAAIYCRISRDPEGERAGVERQETDCRALAERLGYAVTDVYTENDVGASTRSRKARPEYAAMLARARAGSYAAVLAYSNSRLTRRPREVEDLLELAERHGVAIRTCVSGDWDLSTADGRAVARTIAAWDGAEAERISERVKRARLASATAGKVTPSRRRFGYSPDGSDLVTREAVAIRDAYAAVLAGASLLGVAKQWTREGFPMTQGPRPGSARAARGATGWDPASVRAVLDNPRNAGLSVYHGEVVGVGDWPAIVSVETWQAMHAKLAARKTGRVTHRLYLLTGVARCVVCGATMRAGTNGDGTRPTYVCSARHEGRKVAHVTRKTEPVDNYVSALVVERLARPDARDLLIDHERPDVEGLRDEAQTIRARLDSIASEFADGVLTASQLRTLTERLRANLAAVEGQLADAGRVDVLGPLVGAEDVAAAWDALDMDRRRAIVSLLMDVTIMRTRQGGRTFDPESVRIEWRQA